MCFLFIDADLSAIYMPNQIKKMQLRGVCKSESRTNLAREQFGTIFLNQRKKFHRCINNAPMKKNPANQVFTIMSGRD
jgi:hypothetical protein